MPSFILNGSIILSLLLVLLTLENPVTAIEDTNAEVDTGRQNATSSAEVIEIDEQARGIDDGQRSGKILPTGRVRLPQKLLANSTISQQALRQPRRNATRPIGDPIGNSNRQPLMRSRATARPAAANKHNNRRTSSTSRYQYSKYRPSTSSHVQQTESVNRQELEKIYASNEDYDFRTQSAGSEYSGNHQAQNPEGDDLSYANLPDEAEEDEGPSPAPVYEDPPSKLHYNPYYNYAALNYPGTLDGYTPSPNYDYADHQYSYNYNLDQQQQLEEGPQPITEIEPLAPMPPASNYECHCPQQQQQQQLLQDRQNVCENSLTGFWNALVAFGRSLWDLARIVGTSSLPFVIPLLVAKIVLVPLKILKLFGLIKLLFKLFIILPFVVRFLLPHLAHSLSLHHLLFQHHKPHQQHGHRYAEVIEARDKLNGSALLMAAADERPGADDGDDELETKADPMLATNDVAGFAGCPSKSACEFGAFLATATRSHFPRNLVEVLRDRAEDAVIESKYENATTGSRGTGAYNAFVVALGKSWTPEECHVYKCFLVL